MNGFNLIIYCLIKLLHFLIISMYNIYQEFSEIQYLKYISNTFQIENNNKAKIF
jgi:hypothetical protein